MAKVVQGIFFIAFFLVGAVREPPLLYAHDFWIEKQGKDFKVVYGHGDQREEFDPSKIKSIKAFDLQGKGMAVSKEKGRSGLLLKTSKQPSLILIEIDDGYWSKTIYGWKNVPKRKARRVVESIRSFYYSKAMISWNDMVQEADAHIKLNVVPLKNPFGMKAGDLLPFKVLYDGKPLVGTEVERGSHEKIATTDADGIAKVQLPRGYQVITVKHKEPIKNDPDAEYISITSTLTFEVAQ